MHIISGTHKRRKLEIPKSAVRPTMDKVREAIFAMIRSEVSNAKVLDLFAGSGSLGLEALSEGAESCDFVESSYTVVKILQKNISNLAFDKYAHIHNCSAFSYLKNCIKTYDIIFFDPPYKREFAGKIIEAIYVNNVLSDDGIVVAETGKSEDISIFENFIIKEKIYGDTKVTILMKGTV
ncbi:16S rRNA (guanine(966)-N(2))-methyltransferase RsmD [bacterium]|nr:16S rRNA (guanine(966)-N(2))-methyltransferase RsmD [Candidatus Celaenobacter polaris]TSA27167.1 MAG: 16S rRNA (guanine(966)-N(2))-methyltransferase RsmD [bacterium]